MKTPLTYGTIGQSIGDDHQEMCSDIECRQNNETNVTQVSCEESSQAAISKAASLVSLLGTVVVVSAIISLSYISSYSSDPSRTTSTNGKEDYLKINRNQYFSDEASKEVISPRPNFIFILVDDLEWNAFGYADHRYAAFTPNMGSLLHEGIYFTRYYGQEMCTPARSAFLTGRYPSTVGTQTINLQVDTIWGLNITEKLLPEVLREHGNYKNYMLGKWHLGHCSPDYLPTSRGFDEYLGYLTGAETYWSKISTPGGYLDFTISDTQCYDRYQGDDEKDYSTFIYERKAVDAIMKHDYASQPLFMYFASQAVHNPFGDTKFTEFVDGIPAAYVGDKIAAYNEENVVGKLRQQLFLSLHLLDKAVGRIVDALTSVDQLDNTYIIVSADNGGCYFNGGRDGPLRGTKGTLWEGGTKVDSFIYSPLLPQHVRGTQYGGISHITDWFPTILELAGIDDYTPAEINKFDGVSQVKAMLGEEPNTREFVLYNVYTGLPGTDVNVNANGAIRNERYKLLHVFVDNSYDEIFAEDVADERADDDIASESDCSIDTALEGTFQYLLFDIDNDISEKNNLYGEPTLAHVQAQLTAELERHANAAAAMDDPPNVDGTLIEFWNANGGFVQPWVVSDSSTESKLRKCDGDK